VPRVSHLQSNVFRLQAQVLGVELVARIAP
jgi:hypothetical protein